MQKGKARKRLNQGLLWGKKEGDNVPPEEGRKMGFTWGRGVPSLLK